MTFPFVIPTREHTPKAEFVIQQAACALQLQLVGCRRKEHTGNRWFVQLLTSTVEHPPLSASITKMQWWTFSLHSHLYHRSTSFDVLSHSLSHTVICTVIHPLSSIVYFFHTKILKWSYNWPKGAVQIQPDPSSRTLFPTEGGRNRPEWL